MALPSSSSIENKDIVETLRWETSLDQHAVTLELDGEPAVVVITPAAYEQYIELRRAHWDRLFAEEDDPFVHMTSDEIDELAKAEVDAVREQMYREGRQYG